MPGPLVVATADFHTDEIILHAASLLSEVDHPFAAALSAMAQQQDMALLPAAHVRACDSLGWAGRVNGKICVLGKNGLMAQAHIDTGTLASEACSMVDSGGEAYFLSIGDHLAGLLGMPGSSRA